MPDFEWDENKRNTREPDGEICFEDRVLCFEEGKGTHDYRKERLYALLSKSERVRDGVEVGRRQNGRSIGAPFSLDRNAIS